MLMRSFYIIVSHFSIKLVHVVFIPRYLELLNLIQRCTAMPIKIIVEINSDIHLKKTDNEEIEGGKEGGDKLGK